MSRIGATTALADPELMTWDSEWWGIQIAKATHPDVDRWAAENTVGLMWLLVPSDRPEEAQEAEARGWRFMDVRVEFERPLSANTIWPRFGGEWLVRSHRPDEVDALAGIAREAHRITRFYADPSLPAERCDDLYEQWLRNSCAGWAVRVFAAVSPDPVGYVTVHLDGDTASIGLIATHADYRRQRMGHSLVDAAVQWASREEGIKRMTVVTQGRNIAAQRLFQKCGFRTSRTDLWFHKRFDQ